MFSFICKPVPLLPGSPLSAISSQLTGAAARVTLPFPPPAPSPALAAWWRGVPRGAALPRSRRGIPGCGTLGAAGRDTDPAWRGGARVVPGWCPARGPGAAGRGPWAGRGPGAAVPVRAGLTLRRLHWPGRGRRAAPGGGGHARVLRPLSLLLLLRYRQHWERSRERRRGSRTGHAQRPPGRARRRQGECRRGHQEETGRDGTTVLTPRRTGTAVTSGRCR